MDLALILQQRWFFMVSMILILGGYLVFMDKRRFLTIVMLPMLFHWVFETINIVSRFPFDGLTYTTPTELEFMVVLIPFSPIIFKTLLYIVTPYIVTSSVTRKWIDSKIDAVIDRGKKVMDNMIVGFSSTILSTLTVMFIEPLLANGDAWMLGTYEEFDFEIYFGINPIYFFGWMVYSFLVYVNVTPVESMIGFKKDEKLFDYEGKVQKRFQYHVFGIFVYFFVLGFFTFIAMSYVDIGIAVVNLVLIVPAIILFLILMSRWSSSMDDKMIKEYCSKFPDSFVCDL